MEFHEAVKHPMFGFAHGYATREHDEYESFPGQQGSFDFAIAYVNAYADLHLFGPLPTISVCFKNWKEERPVRQIEAPEEHPRESTPERERLYYRALGFAEASIYLGGKDEEELDAESFARIVVDIMGRGEDPKNTLETLWDRWVDVCKEQAALKKRVNNATTG